MPELREVFEMTTKQMEPDVNAWREQERRQRGSARNKRIGAFAVAAALGIVAVVVMGGLLGGRGAQDTTTPADEPLPTTATPVEVARGFVEAFGEMDADRAISYLAHNADLSALEGVQGTQDLRLLLSLLEAQGYRQMNIACAETGNGASGTSVRCTYDFHAIRSDEIGLGPYRGSYLDVTVRDGEVLNASIHWELGEFATQMWEPFAEWVRWERPKEGAVMFNPSYTNWQLTKDSVRLWGQLSRDYVEHVTEGTA